MHRVIFAILQQLKFGVMQQVAEKKKNKYNTTSIWRTEFETKMKMSVEEQVKLRNSRWDEILKNAKSVDEMLLKCNLLMTDEDEIAEMVSKDRRERYGASLRY